VTSPQPGDIARYAFGGPVRNDATLGLVVDWTTLSGGSGSAQLSQLPPPVDVQATAYQRDAVILSGPGTTEPTTAQVPLRSVLMRAQPPALAYRVAQGWRIADAQGDRIADWSALTGNWRLIWVGA
jgi:hypothetical protein